MTSVEVAPLLPPPPPPPDAVSPLLSEGETAYPSGDGGPSSTYQWLSSVPLVSSAGSTVYGWYEGSKNCTRVSKYALETVESSVKYVADTAAPVVKKPSKLQGRLTCCVPRLLILRFSANFPSILYIFSPRFLPHFLSPLSLLSLSLSNPFIFPHS